MFMRSSVNLVGVSVLSFALLAGLACVENGQIEPAPQMATHTPHDMKYFQAELFFISWNTSTQTALSISDARRNADVSISYREPDLANGLADWLQNEVHRLPPGETSQDVRLVIDFVDRAGVKTTFYATRFGFYSEDGQIERKVDDAFRRTFESLAIPSKLFPGRY